MKMFNQIEEKNIRKELKSIISEAMGIALLDELKFQSKDHIEVFDFKIPGSMDSLYYIRSLMLYSGHVFYIDFNDNRMNLERVIIRFERTEPNVKSCGIYELHTQIRYRNSDPDENQSIESYISSYEEYISALVGCISLVRLPSRQKEFDISDYVREWNFNEILHIVSIGRTRCTYETNMEIDKDGYTGTIKITEYGMDMVIDGRWYYFKFRNEHKDMLYNDSFVCNLYEWSKYDKFCNKINNIINKENK